MLTSPGVLWRLMVLCMCMFATVAWPDAPAVAWVAVPVSIATGGVWFQVNTSQTFLSVMLRSFTDG